MLFIVGWFKDVYKILNKDFVFLKVFWDLLKIFFKFSL